MIFKKVSILACSLMLVACKSTSIESTQAPSLISSAIENRVSIKPIILIEAMYPEQAFKAGIQGFCKVSFDLSKDAGLSKPMNIKIVECTPKKIFENACTSAVSKWRFKSIESLRTNESTDGLITNCKFESSGV